MRLTSLSLTAQSATVVAVVYSAAPTALLYDSVVRHAVTEQPDVAPILVAPKNCVLYKASRKVSQ